MSDRHGNAALAPLAAGGETLAHLRPIAALAATAGAAAIAFYLYGRRLRASADDAAALARNRRALRVGVPAANAVALAAMAATGWADLLAAIAESVPGGRGAASGTVSVVVGLAAPVVAVVGAYLGAFPAIKALRDVDVTAATVVVRLLRYVVGMVVLVTLLAGSVVAVSSGAATGLDFAGSVLAVGVALFAGSPWLVRLLQSTRPPTDAERERIRRLSDDAGLDVGEVRVLRTADAKRAVAFVRGVPGYRHLFVADYLLDRLDDDRLRCYLALRAARAGVFHLEAKLLAVVGTVALAASLALGYVTVPGLGTAPAVLAVAAVGAAALWSGQRLVYRADAYAAERTSRETVEETIRAVAELNDASIDRGRIATLRRMEPPLVRRIDRLRDAAADQSD